MSRKARSYRNSGNRASRGSSPAPRGDESQVGAWEDVALEIRKRGLIAFRETQDGRLAVTGIVFTNEKPYPKITVVLTESTILRLYKWIRAYIKNNFEFE